MMHLRRCLSIWAGILVSGLAVLYGSSCGGGLWPRVLVWVPGISILPWSVRPRSHSTRHAGIASNADASSSLATRCCEPFQVFGVANGPRESYDPARPEAEDEPLRGVVPEKLRHDHGDDSVRQFPQSDRGLLCSVP